MKLKWQLPVIDKIYINGGFLFKETICCGNSQRLGNEIAEVTGVALWPFNLFSQVDYRVPCHRA